MTARVARRREDTTRVRRALSVTQGSIVALASLLAAFMGAGSQGGGIDPITAFFCPALGQWSFLFGPNDRSLGEWSAVQWWLTISSTCALLASSIAARRASRRVTMQASAAACVLSTLFWVMLGLARVAYSMA